MKLITTTALTLLTVTAGPAIAQGYGSSTSAQQMQQPQRMQGSAQPANAPPNKQATVKPSKGALKAIFDLQTAVNKNDLEIIPARVAAAQAVATTKEDRYLIGQLQLKAALTAKDNNATAAALDAIAASAYLDQAKMGELYFSLGSQLYNDKQYAPAEAAFQKATAVQPGNAQAFGLLGESYLAAGQKDQAVAAFQRAVQVSASAGSKPDEALLKRALTVAYDAQSPAAIEIGRQWAAAYPSADSWRNSIAVYRNLSRPDVEGTLDLLRLMQATNAMTSSGDYALLARAAADQGNYNEAQAVLDAGIAAKVVNPANPELSDLVNGLKSKPKATRADLAEATKTAANGMALLRIGDRYYAMGDYAKAVELYRMSMSKPGVDAAVANLHIGMALARSGDKAGATTALNAVTGSRADIAKFWLTYVNQRA
jgi:tetratricopeptide (TPR) repeat protein